MTTPQPDIRQPAPLTRGAEQSSQEQSFSLPPSDEGGGPLAVEGEKTPPTRAKPSCLSAQRGER